MIKHSLESWRGALLTAALLYAAGAVFSVSGAVTTSITSDGTLGTTVTPSGNVYDINGGTFAGNNQFHSFDQFSVGAGDIASFNGPVGTANVISRVTGGNVSEIDGTMRSTIDGANLWFLNPAGIMFGENAQLDLTGSFHASTADYLKLSDGGVFYADLGQGSVLTSAPPSAFGFLSVNPASIDVQAGNLGATVPLQVPLGETLSLVGGALNLGAAEVRNEAGEIVEDARPASIFAPGGRINLVSVASAGEAIFDGKGFNVDGFSELGNINLKGGDIFGGAVMMPTFIDSKEVFIQGGQLVIDNALISPGLFSLFGLGPLPDGGEVNVQVSGDVNMTGTNVDPFIGNAPGIVTFAGAFFAAPETFPDAKVPDITIEASSLTVSNIAAVQTADFGPGAPGEITVNADTVTVENGGSLSALNFYDGAGGNITVSAREVNLSGDGTPSPTGVTGIAAQNFIHPCFGCANFDPRLTSGDGGSIIVNAADHVNISGNASIVTDSIGFGDGGDITINTKDMLLTGAGEFSGAIAAQTVLVGSSGDITIDATGEMQINDGFRITAATSSNGDGGTVNVSAGQSITMTGADSRILSTTAQLPDEQLDAIFLGWLGVDFATLVELTGNPDANLFDVLALTNAFGFTNVIDLTPGNAGTINISTPSLTMNSDTRVVASTGWDGNAGSVIGNVGSLFILDDASIRSQSGIEQGGQLLLGAGDAGTVNLAATNLISISGAGSTITTSTLGEGDGGDVSLNAGNQVQISNGGSVTADSFGTGLTGNIDITAGTDIVLNKGAISTLAETSDGGNIKLTAPNIVQLTGSQITTSVESGEGGGGNINIDPEFIILNNSQITANAFGGPGGNISLTANNFIPSADSTVQASSTLSTQGTIVVASPENNIAGAIAQLPQDIIDTSGLLPERCAARTAGGAQSSFVVAGRGGLPTNPDNYLPSFGTGSVPLKSAGGPPSGTTEAALTSARDIAVAMAAWNCVPGSERSVPVNEVISQLF
jgi:filamentous hemagglutinin family protein